MATAAPRDHAMPRWQRALLPAVEGSPGADGDDRLRRSARDWLVDLVIFTLAVAIGAAGVHSDVNGASLPLAVLDVGLGCLACVALWWRRRHPVAIAVLTMVASAASGGAGGAALAGMFTVAVHCPPRWTARVAVLSVVTRAIHPTIYGPHDRYHLSGLEFGAVATTVAVGYGLYVRVRRELVLSLQERNRRLESEQDLRLSEARHAERTRIAREMHDVLAHRISLLSVHAGALEFNPSAAPEEIARAAEVIRMSARAAQEELREVVGVLRDDDTESGYAGPLRPPQPTLVDVPELIDESRRAGMDVTSRIDLNGDRVPPLIGRTVYRLVQEALTNARKHAPGQRVTIAIAGDGDADVIIEIVNRPLVGRASGDAQSGGSGTGLIGLAERVQLAGGRLSHEALDDGGFVLRAILPRR
jgi:signal transduction histidine kinase